MAVNILTVWQMYFTGFCITYLDVQVEILEDYEYLFIFTSWFSSGQVQHQFTRPDGQIDVNQALTAEMGFINCHQNHCVSFVEREIIDRLLQLQIT